MTCSSRMQKCHRLPYLRQFNFFSFSFARFWCPGIAPVALPCICLQFANTNGPRSAANRLLPKTQVWLCTSTPNNLPRKRNNLMNILNSGSGIWHFNCILSCVFTLQTEGARCKGVIFILQERNINMSPICDFVPRPYALSWKVGSGFLGSNLWLHSWTLWPVNARANMPPQPLQPTVSLFAIQCG